jgi:hypothetical protein
MGSESGIYSQAVTYGVLVGLVALYPQDCLNLVALVSLRVRALLLNYFLMFRAWLMYRQICRDFASIGLPKPAFKFTPLWER